LGSFSGVKGQVIVNALIAETGNIIEVEIIQSLPGGLTEATVKAVKDGQAVKVWKRVTITFK